MSLFSPCVNHNCVNVRQLNRLCARFRVNLLVGGLVGWPVYHDGEVGSRGNMRVSGIQFRAVVMCGLCLVFAVRPESQAQNAPQQEIRARFQRANEALNAGNATTAEQELRAILALNPHNAEAHAKLGFALFMRDRWADAAEELRQVLKAQPNLANAQAVLGICEK